VVNGVLDSSAEGPGFKSQPRRCRVTVLGKLFTPIVPLFTEQKKIVAALLRVAGVTARFMTHVTCRLTAKNRDQLRNPTLGNRLWATFTFTFRAEIVGCFSLSSCVGCSALNAVLQQGQR